MELLEVSVCVCMFICLRRQTEAVYVPLLLGLVDLSNGLSPGAVVMFVSNCVLK